MKLPSPTPEEIQQDLRSLPCDWRLVRVGRDKQPLAGQGWFDRDNFSPDEAAKLNGCGPPAWGLKSGPASGVVVLDLDDEGWRESFQEVTGHPIEDLPPTIGWTSGKPGRSGHAFAVEDPDWWPHMANRRSWSNVNGRTCWELRGDRHQAIIIGHHPETGGYRWLPGRSPHELPDPAPAPEWLLEAMVVAQEDPQAPPVEPSAEDASRALAMLRCLPPDQFTAHDDWLKIGMALHHTDQGLLGDWIEWSKRIPTRAPQESDPPALRAKLQRQSHYDAPEDEAECRRRWESFGRRKGSRPVTIRTLHTLARQHGYRESRRDHQQPPEQQVQDSSVDHRAADEAGEIELESHLSDWLPIVLPLAFGIRREGESERWLCIEGCLHCWCGTYYEPVDDAALAPRITPVLERLYYVRRDRRGIPIEHVHFWAKPSRVAEVIAWFKKKLGPCTSYNPANAINLRNGTLSWTWIGTRMELHFSAHSPDEVFTYCLPYDFDLNADPTYLCQLLEAVDGHDRDTLQRILGSGLELERYRANRGRPRALLQLGDGENGKDTVRGALLQTLGGRGMTGCTISDFQQYDRGRKFPVAPLRGARINWSAENTSFARLEGIQSLKAAITGDELAWEIKNVQEEQFTPNAIFVFNCNEAPLLDGSQAAMLSRWHAITFSRRFTRHPDPTNPNELPADPRFKDDLNFIRENICSAMLNWLLEGLQLAVAEGIDYSSNPTTIEHVRRQSSHLFDFVDDIALAEAKDAELELSVVWSLLQSWYQKQNILHLDDKGRPTWNDRDMTGDRPVRIPRDLERRLRAVFPKLRSKKHPKTRLKMLVGVALLQRGVPF